MKDITKIMKKIYLNKETYTYEQLEKEFGKEIWNKFSQFACGGIKPYCKLTGGSPGHASLTPEGCREYHKLKLEENEAARTRALTYATIGAGSAGLALSFMVVLQWYSDLYMKIEGIPQNELITGILDHMWPFLFPAAIFTALSTITILWSWFKSIRESGKNE